MFNTPCVIFAGGKSSRMKRDKSLLPFSGYSTLTEYQYSRLSQLFSHVYISCKNKNKFNFQANFIEDMQDDYAPTSGFLASFQTLQCEKIFVISVDTPFISKIEIAKILEHDKEDIDASIARLHGKLQPLCGVYHQSLEHKFLQMAKKSEHKLGYLLQKVRTNYVDFSDEENFLNLNHPHEYEIALQRIKRNH
jgi:molybdopterin-guanine dinucleotide biosynthesis protein A